MKKTIIAGVGTILGVVIGGVTTASLSNNEKNRLKSLSNKHLDLMKLFNQWMITKQEGKSITEYLNENQIKTIAIYGMSYVGQRLYDELKNTNIVVKYGIDKNAASTYSELKVITPDETLEEVDAIIVTAISFYEEIEEMLEYRIDCTILSLEDILFYEL